MQKAVAASALLVALLASPTPTPAVAEPIVPSVPTRTAVVTGGDAHAGIAWTGSCEMVAVADRRLTGWSSYYYGMVHGHAAVYRPENPATYVSADLECFLRVGYSYERQDSVLGHGSPVVVAAGEVQFTDEDYYYGSGAPVLLCIRMAFYRPGDYYPYVESSEQCAEAPRVEHAVERDTGISIEGLTERVGEVAAIGDPTVCSLTRSAWWASVAGVVASDPGTGDVYVLDDKVYHCGYW